MPVKPEDRPVAGFAIVSGGSSGIGLALSRLLARRGIRVAMVARDQDRLAAAAALVAGEGGLVVPCPLDVRDERSCLTTVQRLVAEFGPPDWVVCCAGIVEPGRFVDQPLALYRSQVETNYFGSLNLAHACAPAMIGARRGHLVFVASGVALLGIPGYSAYSASKFAVRGLAEALRSELAPACVRVSIAYPPDTDTPQLAYEAGLRPPETAAIASASGVWQTARVAQEILQNAERGRFAIAIGWPLRLLALFQGLVAPVLQRKHARLARKFRNEALRPPSN